MHKGKRSELVSVACLCQTATVRAEDVEEEVRSRPAKAPRTQQKTRVGNMEALDRTSQGIKESYERKLKLVSKCYVGMPVQKVFAAIMGAKAGDPVLEGDSDADDEGEEVPAIGACSPGLAAMPAYCPPTLLAAGVDRADGQAGRQGARLLPAVGA